MLARCSRCCRTLTWTCLSDPVRLQMHAIGDADFAPDHRDTIDLFRLMLIGQHELAEAFGRQIKGAVEPPDPVVPPCNPASFCGVTPDLTMG